MSPKTTPSKERSRGSSCRVVRSTPRISLRRQFSCMMPPRPWPSGPWERKKASRPSPSPRAWMPPSAAPAGSSTDPTPPAPLEQPSSYLILYPPRVRVLLSCWILTQKPPISIIYPYCGHRYTKNPLNTAVFCRIWACPAPYLYIINRNME